MASPKKEKINMACNFFQGMNMTFMESLLYQFVFIFIFEWQILYIDKNESNKCTKHT